MFVSIEPFSGNYIDVYPDNIQEKLKILKINESINLGPDCFNAKIQRLSNSYIQTTPSIKSLKKRQGRRSVVFLDHNIEYINVYKFNNQWTFHPATSVQKQIRIKDCIRYPSTNIVWQWSINSIFLSNQENDWITYNTEDSHLIENAFQQNTSVMVQIGMKQYSISFINDDEDNLSVFGYQKDLQSNKRRFIRRALRKSSQFECPTNEIICALCMDEFNETKHLPWIKTECNHYFHAVCFDKIKTNETKCPICRTELL